MAEKAKTLLAKIRFLEWLSTRTDLTVEDYRLATVLTSLWSARKGYAWPSQDQLSAVLMRDKRAVRRSVHRLVERDVFKVRWPGPGRGHATEYIPRFDMVPDGDIYQLMKGDLAVSPFNDASKPLADGPEKGTSTSEKGASESEKGTSASVKGDLAMSPHPSKTPSELSSTEESYNRSSSEASPLCADALPDVWNEVNVSITLAIIERELKAGLLGKGDRRRCAFLAWLGEVVETYPPHDGNPTGGRAQRLYDDIGMLEYA